MMNVDTVEILSENEIPCREAEVSGEKYLEITASEVSPERLRKLGFRLGHGSGEILYLIYYRGKFCGVVQE